MLIVMSAQANSNPVIGKPIKATQRGPGKISQPSTFGPRLIANYS
jgi:hypothetical protein